MKRLFFITLLTCLFLTPIARAELKQQRPAAPSCPRASNLVMVHGFSGSEDTWRRWLDLLQTDEELACVNVYTFSYETGYAPEEPGLDELGGSLREALSGLAASGDALFLVAHSMGGLVIKKAILRDLAAPSFLPQVRQVIFIASPHSGIRRPFAFFAGMKGQQVKELRHPNVRRLRRQWSEATEALPYPVSFCAVIGTKDGLVPRYSAKGGLDDVLALPKDHITVKEPDSTESPLYQKLKTALLASLQ